MLSSAHEAGRVQGSVWEKGDSRSAALQGPRGLLQGGRHNLRGQVEVLAQELDALVRQKPAVAPTCITKGCQAHLPPGSHPYPFYTLKPCRGCR